MGVKNEFISFLDIVEKGDDKSVFIVLFEHFVGLETRRFISATICSKIGTSYYYFFLKKHGACVKITQGLSQIKF